MKSWVPTILLFAGLLTAAALVNYALLMVKPDVFLPAEEFKDSLARAGNDSLHVKLDSVLYGQNNNHVELKDSTHNAPVHEKGKNIVKKHEVYPGTKPIIEKIIKKPETPVETFNAKEYAKLIEAMTPENAAKVLVTMEEEKAKAILFAMKKKQAGKILGSMDPSRVAKLMR